MAEPNEDPKLEETEEFKQAVTAAVTEQVVGLKAKNEELLGKNKSLREVTEQMEGVDPKRYKELLAADQKREEESAKRKGDWEQRERQLTKKHEEALAEAKSKEDGLNRQLEGVHVGRQITEALAEHKGDPVLLTHLVREKLQVVADDSGERRVIVVDKDGDKRHHDGAPMTTSQLVAEMKESAKYGKAFEGTGSSGSALPAEPGKGGAPAGSGVTYI